jgi:hypothetical protein
MKVNKNTTISVWKKTMMMMSPLAEVATAIDTNDISTTNINNNHNISGIRRASVTNTTINQMLFASTCAEAYENRSNNIAVLLAMGIGLKNLSVDITEEPYRSSRSRHSLVPTAKELLLKLNGVQLPMVYLLIMFQNQQIGIIISGCCFTTLCTFAI